MGGSIILQQATKISKVSRENATHFALCYRDKIRFLIDVNGGKKRLKSSIAAYSYRLNILMMMIDKLPFAVLQATRLGYYVEVKLHSSVEYHVRKTNATAWNMIIGTYDEKQKLVLQCFTKSVPLAKFIKVGNADTETEMKIEINFLSEKHNYKYFKLPKILWAEFQNSTSLFNILTTNEFVGNKIVPGLTMEIVQIYREISAKVQIIEGVECEFSHGDFAPWNIKKVRDGLIVFDWEHCGMRMKGFDIMHYVVVPKVLLEGKDLSVAFDESFMLIKEFIADFSMDKGQFEVEYRKLRLVCDI